MLPLNISSKLCVIFIACILLGGSTAIATIVAMNSNEKILATSTIDMKAEQLKRRGVAMENDLVTLFHQMVESGKLRSGRNDLSVEVVTRSIPIGSSFEDIKVMLHAGGFDYKEVDFGDGVKWLSCSKTIQKASFINVEAALLFRPKIPNDFTSPMVEAKAIIDAATL